MKLCLVIFLVSFSVPVWASLGDPDTSVETDRQALSASHTITVSKNFTVHELTTKTGITVKEYAGPDSRVFAVTWRGRVRPDLKSLLNGYHAEYLQGVANKPRHHGHGQERFTTPHLVVEHGGHMLDVRGRIFIPAQLPPGVAEGDIQ